MTVRVYDHLDIVAHGALPRGEVWSCGLVGAGVAPVTLALDDAKMAASANAAVTRWGTLILSAIPFGTGVTLAGVTVYLRKANTADAAKVAAQAYTGTQPSATITMPNQVALVASLRSSTAGRSARGRIYLPALANAPQPTGGVVGAAATAVANMIAGLNTDLSSAWGLAMAIWAGSTGGQCTNVIVDDVPDTQRRRRNKVPATNTGTAAVPVG